MPANQTDNSTDANGPPSGTPCALEGPDATLVTFKLTVYSLLPPSPSLTTKLKLSGPLYPLVGAYTKEPSA